MRQCFCGLLLLCCVSVFAGNEKYVLATPEQSQHYYALLNQLRCLVCQNESLADSGATLAADLRGEVYSKMRAGQSDREIIHYLTERYGDFILYKPPIVTRTWVLWFGPVALLVLCLAAVWGFARRRQLQLERA